MLVTAASVQDGLAGLQLLTKAAAAHPALCKAWADSAYRTAVIEHGARLGIDVEVVRPDPATKGFTPLPCRWAVERTFGWLMLHRRLARDYEALPARSEAMIHLAMIDLMTRRCTANPPQPGEAPKAELAGSNALSGPGCTSRCSISCLRPCVLQFVTYMCP